MFGKNPIRPPLKGDGSTLEVQSIFPTLQGEGPFVGWPSVFLRLGGCNLACAFCDTEFESFKEMPLAEIIEQIEKLAAGGSGKRARGLVVITGGEPFRQPIELICNELIKKGFKVQIETNGTLYRPLPAEVNIVCSPKNTGSGYGKIRPDLAEKAAALKFIISANNPDYQDIPELGQTHFGIPVYVQPMDEYDPEKNKANMAHAVKLAQANGYRLSLQTHKILGIE